MAISVSENSRIDALSYEFQSGKDSDSYVDSVAEADRLNGRAEFVGLLSEERSLDGGQEAESQTESENSLEKVAEKMGKKTLDCCCVYQAFKWKVADRLSFQSANPTLP